MTPKRNKTIKIRVTENELSQLHAICPNTQLAKWMRELCLGQPQKKKQACPVDPGLLRQLAAIGNNLNQIARAVHQDHWRPIDRIAICAHLKTIEAALTALHRKN